MVTWNDFVEFATDIDSIYDDRYYYDDPIDPYWADECLDDIEDDCPEDDIDYIDLT